MKETKKETKRQRNKKRGKNEKKKERKKQRKNIVRQTIIIEYHKNALEKVIRKKNIK